jgi:1-acyl-sn-glycerol-3-phosphate acyltransferase
MEQIPHDRSYIIVANHASYMDGLVLLAVLPGSPTYVVKRELTDRFISRVLFRRFGTEFVERSEAKRGVEDTERVLQTVRQGQSVVFLPEGTFVREPGLRPFRMGAFVIAAQLGIPVVPLAIRGTRSILRAGQWFPRRGMVYVTVDNPLEPSGTDWEAAIRLRDVARGRILNFCGEPDLARDIETNMT